MKRRIGYGVAATIGTIAIALLSVSCGAQARRGIQDAPIARTDNGGVESINFGNNWPNVQTKCSHGTRLFVVARGSGPFVHIVPNDATCGGQG